MKLFSGWGIFAAILIHLFAIGLLIGLGWWALK